ncbi:MAG: hypothetical protein AAF916_10885 [Planctomycetota bacterium]
MTSLRFDAVLVAAVLVAMCGLLVGCSSTPTMNGLPHATLVEGRELEGTFVLRNHDDQEIIARGEAFTQIIVVDGHRARRIGGRLGDPNKPFGDDALRFDATFHQLGPHTVIQALVRPTDPDKLPAHVHGLVSPGTRDGVSFSVREFDRDWVTAYIADTPGVRMVEIEGDKLMAGSPQAVEAMLRAALDANALSERDHYELLPGLGKGVEDHGFGGLAGLDPDAIDAARTAPRRPIVLAPSRLEHPMGRNLWAGELDAARRTQLIPGDGRASGVMNTLGAAEGGSGNVAFDVVAAQYIASLSNAHGTKQTGGTEAYVLTVTEQERRNGQPVGEPREVGRYTIHIAKRMDPVYRTVKSRINAGIMEEQLGDPASALLGGLLGAAVDGPDKQRIKNMTEAPLAARRDMINFAKATTGTSEANFQLSENMIRYVNRQPSIQETFAAWEADNPRHADLIPAVAHVGIQHADPLDGRWIGSDYSGLAFSRLQIARLAWDRFRQRLADAEIPESDATAAILGGEIAMSADDLRLLIDTLGQTDDVVLPQHPPKPEPKSREPSGTRRSGASDDPDAPRRGPRRAPRRER